MPFGQAPSFDDVFLLIGSIEPITGARGRAMARLGVNVVDLAVPLATGDSTKQLAGIRSLLAAHLQQAANQDADELYSDPDGLRFALSHAFNAINVLAPGAQRDQVFTQGFSTLKNIALAPVTLAPTESTAAKTFKVLSVLGGIAVTVGTAVALFTGRSKITKLRNR